MIDNHFEDHIEKMRHHLREYQKAHFEQCAKYPSKFEVNVENYSDSYKWLLLPEPCEDQSGVPYKIASDPTLYPDEFLSGLLLEIIKNVAQKGFSLNGIGIDRVGTHIHFCISGASTLEELQNAYDEFQASHDSQGKK